MEPQEHYNGSDTAGFDCWMVVYLRNMTGQGQHIDQAQMVAGIPLTGPALLDFTVNRRASRRDGFPPAIAPTGPTRPW